MLLLVGTEFLRICFSERGMEIGSEAEKWALGAQHRLGFQLAPQTLSSSLKQAQCHVSCLVKVSK